MKIKITNKITTLVLTILTLILFGATIGTAAPGDLDPTFGIGGQIYPPSGSQTPQSWGNDMVIQPDQKIIVSSTDFNFGLLLSRYLPNGNLDPAFGVGGRVFQTVGGGGNLALQPDGKILVFSGFQGLSIFRYKPDGNLDTAFDGDGRLTFSAFAASSLAVQNDGKILVAGTKYIGPNYGDPSLFGLARINSDGSFDTAFGSNGIVTTAFPYTSSYMEDIVIQADGKIVAAGTTFNINSSYNIAVSKYNVDGSLDTSFGTSGRVVTPTGFGNGSDVNLQADNKIVVAGQTYDNGLVIRYMPDGLLDASFGDAGQVLIPNLSPFNIAVQSNGKIVIAGGTTNYDPSNSNHEIGRLLSNGTFDPTFGNNGRVTTVFPNLPQGGVYINGRALGMAIQGDGKIVTGGYWSGTDWDGNHYWSYMAITRYLGDSAAPRPAQFDFDGDRRADLSVFRPSDRTWYLNQSINGFSATQFGLSTDKLKPADYDGDGKTDISVYRDGTWFWLKSSDNSFNARQFGIASDIPVPADYTGDGRAELTVYRDGAWWSLNLRNNQASVVNFGLATDKPVPADYDGDGRTDQAVYRGSGEWHFNRSTLGDNGYTVIQFGISADKPVPADYDGDGKADLAVYRDGTWYLLQSTNGFAAFQWGIATDIPAPADYDGDGRTDPAVYRDGAWHILQSSNGQSATHQFGASGDIPVAAANVQ